MEWRESTWTIVLFASDKPCGEDEGDGEDCSTAGTTFSNHAAPDDGEEEGARSDDGMGLQGGRFTDTDRATGGTSGLKAKARADILMACVGHQRREFEAAFLQHDGGRTHVFLPKNRSHIEPHRILM